MILFSIYIRTKLKKKNNNIEYYKLRIHTKCPTIYINVLL